MTRSHWNVPFDQFEIALSVKEDDVLLFYLQTQKTATLVSIVSKQNKFNMFHVKTNKRKSITRSITK